MFKRCNDLRLNGLTHVNSPRVHITITTCNNVIVSNLHIIAPETSPNTDGINVASSTNVNIRDSFIETGDDCIAISGGSSNVKISGIMCGPGHGISIGALGKGGADVVENIEVRNCTMQKTLAGVRIKSWQTSAIRLSDISYSGITGTSMMDSVINLSCSESVACTNIAMDNVYISSVIPGRKVFGKCINAHGRISHVKPWFNCLKP
ncbi:putative endo-polygalacturonase [Helianthus annuus]|nr:putative endo-polygalacturonase [Helianthus annuus]